MEELVYWIWLSMALTVGSESFKKLITKFKTPSEIYSADQEDITSVIGSRSKDFLALADKSLDKAEEILDFCTSKGVGILTYLDPAFPKSLREIKNPPVLLYYRGVLPNFNELPFVSVVGTRHLSDYGRKNAFSLSLDLSRSGAVIVSGMAIGIDGVALAGALSSGGVTVAVIGSGIDVCYPEEHKRLAREIVKQGCVLTEYAPGTKPLGNNFPRRNRLVSGLCCATVVIEGRIRSGALITARCAKEQGRLLYALPGNVDVKTSEVTNLLIKSGAKLITDASDIITDLEARYTGLINPFSVEKDRTALDFDWLRRLEVSCVTPSDGIFTPSRNRGQKDSPGAQGTSAPNDKEEKAAFEPKPKLSLEELGLDGDMLKVYSKIPEGAECFAEDLADAELDMKKIMRILLKLEMGRFIKLLPGGKVKRNI